MIGLEVGEGLEDGETIKEDWLTVEEMWVKTNEPVGWKEIKSENGLLDSGTASIAPVDQVEISPGDPRLIWTRKLTLTM